MVKKRTHTGGWLLLMLWAALLLVFPGQSLAGAKRGVALCLELILPALFPFFVLSSLLIATGFAALCARKLNGILSPLFGVGGSGAAALLLGILGGYPVGARTVAQLVESGACSHAEARRLSLFCNNCGPAFFIGAAGAGIFASRRAGVLLLCANLTAALLIGFLSRLFRGRVCERGSFYQKPAPFPTLTEALPDCVQRSFSASLGVCAYVILFSVLVTLLECTGGVEFLLTVLSPLLPGETGSALCKAFLTGLLEISTGTAALAEGVSSPAALPLAGFLLGWGGLSVHCQSLPFWREAGVPLLPYLSAKLGQGVLSALLTAGLLGLFPLSAPAMAGDFASPVPLLVGQEIVMLWVLSGGYWVYRVWFRGQRARH